MQSPSGWTELIPVSWAAIAHGREKDRRWKGSMDRPSRNSKSSGVVTCLTARLPVTAQAV
jgi:hypothetical protein